MSYTYDQRKRPRGPDKSDPEQTAAPGPSMDALLSGRAAPSAAQKGQPFGLDAAMKAKMENAFGDLSAVKFYKSQAVGQAGAEAIAQGNEIAFAPGMANFSTRSGQERLGHELSHVMSQRSGQVRGSGFLENSALEARADREGAMAAAGQQVYNGPVTHALSSAGPSPIAAGAMQAKRRDADAQGVKAMQAEGKDTNGRYATKHYADYEDLDPKEWEEKTHTPNWFSRKFLGKKKQTYKVHRHGLAAEPILSTIEGLSDIPDEDFLMHPSQEQIEENSPLNLIEPDKINDPKSSQTSRINLPKPSKVKPPKLTRAQKQAKQNADRMFRIQAGMMFGLEDENLNSQKDLNWYEEMKENADEETYTEIYNRGVSASQALVDYRDSLEGDDIDRKNYEASWSAPALERSIYNTIAQEIGFSPGGDAFARKQQKALDQNLGLLHSESAKMQKEANKIDDANFLGDGSNKKRNLYARTIASPEEHARREAERTENYRKIALGGTKKKKGR